MPSITKGELYFTFHDVSINTNGSVQERLRPSVFTFHDVSINTETAKNLLTEKETLHSTMFLLILLQENIIFNPHIFTFHDVSINTSSVRVALLRWISFTFHDVSINTEIPYSEESTGMYLYIPRCFY